MQKRSPILFVGAFFQASQPTWGVMVQIVLANIVLVDENGTTRQAGRAHDKTDILKALHSIYFCLKASSASHSSVQTKRVAI